MKYYTDNFRIPSEPYWKAQFKKITEYLLKIHPLWDAVLFNGYSKMYGGGWEISGKMRGSGTEPTYERFDNKQMMLGFIKGHNAARG